MYYRIQAQPLPNIQEVSLLVRKTVWRCADKRNILVYVREGACTFTINAETHILEKGQFLLIPAEQAYVRKPYHDTDCTMIYIHFKTQEAITPVPSEEIQKELDDMRETAQLSMLSPTPNPPPVEKYFFLAQITEVKEETVAPC